MSKEHKDVGSGVDSSPRTDSTKNQGIISRIGDSLNRNKRAVLIAGGLATGASALPAVQGCAFDNSQPGSENVSQIQQALISGWEAPQKPSFVTTEEHMSPHVFVDGNNLTIYFTSTRNGSINGSRDIWVVHGTEDGNGDISYDTPAQVPGANTAGMELDATPCDGRWYIIRDGLLNDCDSNASNCAFIPGGVNYGSPASIQCDEVNKTLYVSANGALPQYLYTFPYKGSIPQSPDVWDTEVPDHANSHWKSLPNCGNASYHIPSVFFTGQEILITSVWNQIPGGREDISYASSDGNSCGSFQNLNSLPGEPQNDTNAQGALHIDSKGRLWYSYDDLINPPQIMMAKPKSAPPDGGTGGTGGTGAGGSGGTETGGSGGTGATGGTGGIGGVGGSGGSAPVECAPGCAPTMVGDGNCDAACNVAACNDDNGDCAGTGGTGGGTGGIGGAAGEGGTGATGGAAGEGGTGATGGTGGAAGQGGSPEGGTGGTAGAGGAEPQLCATGCTDDMRGDGNCDAACDTAACNNDDGDCETPDCSITVTVNSGDCEVVDCGNYEIGGFVTLRTANDCTYTDPLDNIFHITGNGDSYLSNYELTNPQTVKVEVTHPSGNPKVSVGYRTDNGTNVHAGTLGTIYDMSMETRDNEKGFLVNVTESASDVTACDSNNQNCVAVSLFDLGAGPGIVTQGNSQFMTFESLDALVEPVEQPDGGPVDTPPPAEGGDDSGCSYSNRSPEDVNGYILAALVAAGLARRRKED